MEEKIEARKGFWEELITKTLNNIHDFLPRLVYAIIFLIIGIILIKLIMRMMRRIMDKADTELSVRGFIQSMSLTILYALLLFLVGRTLGIQASSFIAIFTGATVAIGLALQGSLANFAGGLLILLFKPFKIGDEIQIGNNIHGEVADINILYTRVHNWRGEYFSLPNGKVANETVRNNSSDEFRRVEIGLHFSLEQDFDEIRKIIVSTMKKDPKAAHHLPFQVWISGFENYYLSVSARCWCKSSDYWGVYWSQIESIKKALAENNIKLQLPKHIIEKAGEEKEELKDQTTNS